MYPEQFAFGRYTLGPKERKLTVKVGAWCCLGAIGVSALAFTGESLMDDSRHALKSAASNVIPSQAKMARMSRPEASSSEVSVSTIRETGVTSADYLKELVIVGLEMGAATAVWRRKEIKLWWLAGKANAPAPQDANYTANQRVIYAGELEPFDVIIKEQFPNDGYNKDEL